jgi:hypothetical protein
MESCKTDNCCEPTKVVQSLIEKCGTVSLGLAVTFIPPELTGPFYICPTDVSSDLIIKYVLTNLSTTCTIRGTRYINDSLTGLHKVGKCKLAPGQSDTFITTYTIPPTACGLTGGSITSNAVAYVHYDSRCTVLIAQATTVIDGVIIP